MTAQPSANINIFLNFFSIDDRTVEEPSSGTTQAVFNVRLFRNNLTSNSLPATVDFYTENGTASAEDGDYEAASDTLTFTGSETKKQISITVNADSVDEQSKTFKVKLKNPSQGLSIRRGEGIGTITPPAGGGNGHGGTDTTQ